MEAFIGSLVLAVVTIILMCNWRAVDDMPPPPEKTFDPPPEHSMAETIRWRRLTRDWRRDDNRWGFKPGKDEIF